MLKTFWNFYQMSVQDIVRELIVIPTGTINL